MTETEIIDAAEHLDYQNEEAAGHADGRQAAIDAEIDALIADAPAPNPAAFVPTDAAGVDWVLGKCAAARAEAKLIRDSAELMAREAERKAEHLEWKYGPALQTWLRAELAGGSKKSKRLFHGVLGFRTKPMRVQVTNFAALLAWAKATNSALVQTTETVDRDALTILLADATERGTGEQAAGAVLIAADEQFYIK